MPPFRSSAELLTLHAVRLSGLAEAGALARRFDLERDAVAELLLDFEACGWVRHAAFAGIGGWSLTEAGRIANERQLAAERDAAGARPVVQAALARFVPLNARFLSLCTDWQVRALPGEPLAANDHSDFRWDDRVLRGLGAMGRQLAPLGAALSDRLARFDGYVDRYEPALARAERGERSWVDGVGIDSCHRVWFELHEDLIATLGVARGDEPTRVPSP